MGQEQSKNKAVSSSFQQWKELGSKQDLNYGQIRLYENTDATQKMAAIGKIFQNPYDYSMNLKRLQSIQQLNDINGLVKLIEINEHFEENFCSNFYKLISIYEYYENTLQQEINLRQQVYNRKEIISFLQQIIGTLIELQNRQLCHGDLRPSHIMIIQNQQYKIKLPDIDQFRKMAINFDQNYCYLTPDQVRCLNQKQMKFTSSLDPDIFSLGLVALQMGTLKNITDIYNLETVNKDVYNEFTELQGEQLSKLIQLMTQAPVTLNEIYETLIVGDEKFYMCSSSPQKENNRYSLKSAKKGASPSPNSNCNKIQKEIQLKKNWGSEFLQDSEVYVPLNPGDNYLNDQPVVTLAKFNCSILDQPKQEPVSVMKEITNTEKKQPDKLEKKSKSLQKNTSTQRITTSFKFKRTTNYNKFGKKGGVK